MHQPTFDPQEGYQLESPAVFVRWDISEQELVDIFRGQLKPVTGGYYTMPCVSLSGLGHNPGFHFSAGRLPTFEIFPADFSHYPNWKAWFEEFDDHLRETFGPPTQEGADSSEWNFGSVGVRNFMLDRYGPEVRTYLCRPGSK